MLFGIGGIRLEYSYVVGHVLLFNSRDWINILYFFHISKGKAETKLYSKRISPIYNAHVVKPRDSPYCCVRLGSAKINLLNESSIMYGRIYELGYMYCTKGQYGTAKSYPNANCYPSYKMH